MKNERIVNRMQVCRVLMTLLVQVLVIALVVAVLMYLFMPALNIRSIGFIFCLLIVIVIMTAIEYWLYGFERIRAKVLLVALASIVSYLLIGGCLSATMFRASRYHEMVEIEQGDFEKDIPNITNQIQVPIVDMETAQKLGDRTIGNIKNATWYEVEDEYNLIKYQGEFYRISELSYGGFFKYLKAKDSGIPGYVLVNVENQEAKYVQLEEPIRYSPSACFGQKLKRHLRMQYPTYIFGSSFFEIDENGKPYYITSVRTPTIGAFGGAKENSFIITNASTGESEEYKTEELPEWVDHAYDLPYLMKVTKYNQTYVNGWFNSIFSKTDVLNTSYEYRNQKDDEENFAGYNTVITSNNDIVFYTGVTPASVAESNVGFILANPRTGKITYYECAGAEESSAQQAVESLVQDLRYTATFPTVINVDGFETYFMLLKDKAGLVQRYALCNVKDYTKAVQAESLEKCLKLYNEKMGMELSVTGVQEVSKTEGNIQELYQAEIDGCTFYYFTIEGDSNLYMSSIKNSNRQVLLNQGTKVNLEYVQSSEDGIFIVQKIAF